MDLKQTEQMSHPTPHTPNLAPRTSHLTPHTSHLTPHPSRISNSSPCAARLARTRICNGTEGWAPPRSICSKCYNFTMRVASSALDVAGFAAHSSAAPASKCYTLQLNDDAKKLIKRKSGGAHAADAGVGGGLEQLAAGASKILFEAVTGIRSCSRRGATFVSSMASQPKLK